MKTVVFIGIGGIGMSALAQYYLDRSLAVWGYDRQPSKITELLEEKGAKISFDQSCIPEFQPKSTMVVYTPAIDDSQAVMQYFIQGGFVLKKRAEVLGQISKETFCLAVSGTHGKTTTSSILIHLINQGDEKAFGFLGGIATNYGSNYIPGNSAVSVVEADEFDRSFLQLDPGVACVTTTDEDHLDIYGTQEEFLRTFQEFTERVSGPVFYRLGTQLEIEEGFSYGLEEELAEIKATNISIENGAYVFDFISPLGNLLSCRFSLPGKHNLLNALAAISMAQYFGVNQENIRSGLSSFKGVERRFSTRIKSQELILIDDYAHHPTEIVALLEAVKSFYPGKEITGIFQPHLYSRTKDFMDEFAEALSGFDYLGLLPIYPAREQAIPGVTSEVLLGKIVKNRTEIIQKNNFSDFVEQRKTRLVVCFGAGDISVLINNLIDEKSA